MVVVALGCVPLRLGWDIGSDALIVINVACRSPRASPSSEVYHHHRHAHTQRRRIKLPPSRFESSPHLFMPSRCAVCLGLGRVAYVGPGSTLIGGSAGYQVGT